MVNYKITDKELDWLINQVGNLPINLAARIYTFLVKDIKQKQDESRK